MFKVKEPDPKELLEWQMAWSYEYTDTTPFGLTIPKPTKLEFHTQEEKNAYIKKLQERFEKGKTHIFADTIQFIKDMNTREEETQHPVLGTIEFSLAGPILFLFLFSPAKTPIDLPVILGSGIVFAAGVNNLDWSKYSGPFVSLLSIALSPFALIGNTINKISEKRAHKKELEKIQNMPITPKVITEEEKLEEEKEHLKSSINEFTKSLDVSKSQVLADVIAEIRDLEDLLLSIYRPQEGMQYIAELQEKVSFLSDEYFKGNIKAEDFLSLVKKETEDLRDKAEQTKLDEYWNNLYVPAPTNPLFLELKRKREARLKEKEEN